MRKGSRWVGLVVSLALVVVMTVGTISAQAYVYRVGKYDIYYYNTPKTGYIWWAKELAKYIPEAWRSAYTVIGNQTLNGQMQVRFYSTRNNTLGYMLSGTQKIYLNRYTFSTYARWGGTLAHETSHVLFYNYTKAASWTASYMINYRTFITETLARYTGDVVYSEGFKYSDAKVKSELKKYNKLAFGSSNFITWYGMGYYYKNGSRDSKKTAIWGQAAAGYFLTGGLTTKTSSKVANLMYYMRYYSRSAASYLRSSNWETAQYYFEYSFKLAYGYHANASLIYGNIDNNSYLFGKFYYQWYM